MKKDWPRNIQTTGLYRVTTWEIWSDGSGRAIQNTERTDKTFTFDRADMKAVSLIFFRIIIGRLMYPIKKIKFRRSIRKFKEEDLPF